jgi:hypothetical protein
MRNALFVAIMITTMNLLAQERPEISNGQYLWNKPTIMQACDLNGTNDTLIPAGSSQIVSLVGQAFDVINVIDRGTVAKSDRIIVIRVGNYRQKSLNFYKFNYKGPESPSEAAIVPADVIKYQRYFQVREKELLGNATAIKRISPSLTGGVISFPYKLRLKRKSSDFNGVFNLGAAMGIKLPRYDYQKFSYSILFAATFTSVNMDASSARDNLDKLTETNDFAALSFAVGGLVEYDRFQAGLFLGTDRISRLNNNTFRWRYQNKPWVSLGFGYSIFSVEKEGAKAKTND